MMDGTDDDWDSIMSGINEDDEGKVAKQKLVCMINRNTVCMPITTVVVDLNQPWTCRRETERTTM